MTIDEAIEKLKSDAIKDSYNMQGYSKKQKEQFAGWLEELKAIKELDLEIPQHFTKEQSDWIKAYVILKKKEAKFEAIDKVIRILEKRSELGECDYGIIERIEKLKEGAE